MKKLRNFRVNMILWYTISGLWTVTLILRLVETEKNYALLGITAFTLLASLACAIINHCGYLKAKNEPAEEDPLPTDSEN